MLLACVAWGSPNETGDTIVAGPVGVSDIREDVVNLLFFHGFEKCRRFSPPAGFANVDD